MKKNFNLRVIVQVSIVVLMLALSFRHMHYGVEKAAPIDAYCPFGALESFLTYVFTGEYIKRIYASSFILMGVFLTATLFFGRIFCGYFCPLGAIQEWLRFLGKKIGIKKDVELPEKLDHVLRYLKYLLLAAIIYFSYVAGDLVFRAYDPFNAWMHLGEEWEEKLFGYAILGIIVVFSLFSKSWWCRYACPLGAAMSIFKKIGFFKISRDTQSCIGCGNCQRVCPANLPVDKKIETLSADCVSCLKCVKDCPKNSLQPSIFKKNISAKKFGLLAAGTIFLLLLILTNLSIWQTKAPSNIINKNGEVDLSNLRGSNTLQYLIDATGISQEIFQQELGLPENVDAKLKLKDIGIEYGIKNDEGEFLEAEDFRKVVEKNKFNQN